MADARHSRESRRAKKKGKKNWFELVVEGRFEPRIDEPLPISLARSGGGDFAWC